MQIYRDDKVVERLYRQGERLRAGINRAIESLDLVGYFEVLGRPSNLIYATRDQSQQPSQAFRTLFLQETIRRGLLMPSLVVSFLTPMRILTEPSMQSGKPASLSSSP